MIINVRGCFRFSWKKETWRSKDPKTRGKGQILRKGPNTTGPEDDVMTFFSPDVSFQKCAEKGADHSHRVICVLLATGKKRSAPSREKGDAGYSRAKARGTLWKEDKQKKEGSKLKIARCGGEGGERQSVCRDCKNGKEKDM